MPASILTTQLGRIYKLRNATKGQPRQLVALENVNLQVQPGELFGLLGPNGAGKTTLIKIMTTLLAPSSGTAEVAGLDVVRQREQVRERINMVSGGETSGYGLLTVRENLWMFAQFYGIPSKVAHQRIDTLLEIVKMSDRASTKCSDLSTGLRQKMNIVRGFLTDPQVLFLDEPTLGLDVGAARDVREFVRRWMGDDHHRTLLLTTHYMAEADELCGRVAIINKGKVLACDTPANLKLRIQRDVLFQIRVDLNSQVTTERYRRIPGVINLVQRASTEDLTLEFILSADAVLAEVIATLTADQIRILSLQKREPTLEDVFVNLVGQSMEEVEHADAPVADE